MFDWFWEFLYSISKALMQVCDWLMRCAKILVGIEDISVAGEETDFMTYLLTSERVSFAFAAAALLGVIAVFIFSIFAIIRNVTKEQPGITPAQICVKAFKSMLMFAFVPLIMLTLTYFLNVFMEALFEATSQTGSSIGSFLFVTFAQDAGLSESSRAGFLSGTLDYASTSLVSNHIDLSDFNFIFSWIVGGVVMYNLATSLLIFVDRAISIVILYIAAPFSIGSTVIDDGTHFKAWREQILVKFLSAYGTIIAMNIYILITGLVTSSDVIFSNESVLNYVIKIMIVVGGGLTMKKAAGLVANLMASGGGQDINETSGIAGRALGVAASKTWGLAKGAVKYSPVGFVGSAIGGAVSRKVSNMKDKFGNWALNKIGINTDYDTRRLNGGRDDDDDKDKGGNKNDNKADYNGDSKNDQLKNALEGGNGESGSNQNDKKPETKGNQMMSNALSNSGKKDSEKKDE